MPKIGIGGTGNIDHVQMDEQGSTPSTPGAGKSAIYLKADGLYVIDDAGAVTGPMIDTGGGGIGDHGARVYHDANQNGFGSVLTAIAFNSERWDTDGYHDTVSNNSRLTIPAGRAGKYLISGTIRFATNSTGYRVLAINLNGTTQLAVWTITAINGDVSALTISTIYNLAETDYVELQAYENTGANINILASANASPEFMLQQLA